MTEADVMLKASHISRTFGSGKGTVHALKNVNMSIPSGCLVALKGRSGSGKTTLLNLFSTLDLPSHGSILLNGREICGLPEKQLNEIRRKEIGLIFQSSALIPFMSAYENVEFALRVAGVAATKYKTAAEEALSFVGLKARMNHRPFELSGGEQQRAAISRAIAHKPRLILADEPTAELDTRMGLQVMKVFRDLVHYEGITVVITTHDPAIMEIVDRVYALEDGYIVE